MNAVIWAAGAAGLFRGGLQGPFVQAEAPPFPCRLALGAGRVICASRGGEIWDAGARRLLGRCPGVEAMALSPEGRYLYVLCGEGDSLVCCRADTGEMLYFNRAGNFPRDLRLHPGGRLLAVAGGSAGEVLLFSAPELRLIRRIPVPGSPCQAVFMPGGLAVMAAAEEGAIFTLMGMIGERRGVFQERLRLPGLPGALCPWGDGALAAACLDLVIKVRWPGMELLWRLDRPGLVHHMADHPRGLLLSDPLNARLSLLTGPGRERPLFYQEDIFALWQV